MKYTAAHVPINDLDKIEIYTHSYVIADDGLILDFRPHPNISVNTCW